MSPGMVWFAVIVMAALDGGESRTCYVCRPPSCTSHSQATEGTCQFLHACVWMWENDGIVLGCIEPFGCSKKPDGTCLECLTDLCNTHDYDEVRRKEEEEKQREREREWEEQGRKEEERHEAWRKERERRRGIAATAQPHLTSLVILSSCLIILINSYYH